MGVGAPAVGLLWGQARCHLAVQDMEGHPVSKGDTAGTGVAGDTKPPLTLGSSRGGSREQVWEWAEEEIQAVL